MTAYYNEHDPKASAWLRELIRGGHIAPGEVDERSIADVRPDDLVGFTQCHFFAGIGGWSFALRIAGWPDDKPAWTGSCPCQPFSAAGKGLGTADARHLWPVFFGLIRDSNPAIVFGEQVASAAGRLWLAGVRSDLEGLGYGVGAADLCSAGVGSPNIRQRIFWMANAASRGLGIVGGANQPGSSGHADLSGAAQRLAYSNGGLTGNGELQCSGRHGQQPQNEGFGRVDESDRIGGAPGISGPFARNERLAGVVDHAGDQDGAREREGERERDYPACPRPAAGIGRTAPA